MAFDDELGLLGFRLAQEKRDGTRTFSLARNRYLTYWLHLPADDTVALFTWEFAIGEYMDEYGLRSGPTSPSTSSCSPRSTPRWPRTWPRSPRPWSGPRRCSPA